LVLLVRRGKLVLIWLALLVILVEVLGWLCLGLQVGKVSRVSHRRIVKRFIGSRRLGRCVVGLEICILLKIGVIR
jgi:hypothetical protein